MTCPVLPRRTALAAIWLGLSVVGAGQHLPPPGAGEVVAVENCGVTITYPSAPRRVVTMNQATTEIMLALGLEDVLVGTAYMDAAVLPRFAAAYARVPVLAARYPSREVLLAAQPDFVYGAYPSAFGREAAGERDVLFRNGARSYLSPSGCTPAGGRQPYSMAMMYRELRDIGRIFRISVRAERLIATYQEEIAAIQSRIGAAAKPPRVFWYDSEDPPSAGACCGVPNEVIHLAGAENIFGNVAGSWAEVSWEEVIARNPEAIVLADAVWSRSTAKRQLMLERPAFSSIEAVQRRRFISIDFGASTPGIRITEAVRTLAEALYPEKFK